MSDKLLNRLNRIRGQVEANTADLLLEQSEDRRQLQGSPKGISVAETTENAEGGFRAGKGP